LGRAETVGHPMRYGVSFEFLQYFGLRGVHELPPIEKLETLPLILEREQEVKTVESANEIATEKTELAS
jgi:chromosome segregation and condensation protein ScpB